MSELPPIHGGNHTSFNAFEEDHHPQADSAGDGCFHSRFRPGVTGSIDAGLFSFQRTPNRKDKKMDKRELIVTTAKDLLVEAMRSKTLAFGASLRKASSETSKVSDALASMVAEVTKIVDSVQPL